MKHLVPMAVLFLGFCDLAIAQSNCDPWTPTHVATQHLPNAIRVTPNLISGGLPEGELAFEELRGLNIKTIISVDGAEPNVDMAEKHEMRYVHLPHRYDGISPQFGRELAKAITELDGPIYLHCHHGKHRSPAASAVACITAGIMTNEQGKALLQLAGTNANYLGLWESVAKASPVPQNELSMMKAEFPKIARVPAMAKAMVALETTFEKVKGLQALGWQCQIDQSGDFNHQLLLLHEHFAELLRLEGVKKYPIDFVQSLNEAKTACQQMEVAFERVVRSGQDSHNIQELNRDFSIVNDSCKSCHASYRDKAN
jgi:hypothetical protein